MINFPFGTNGKFIILGVPILKHITVPYYKSEKLCNSQKKKIMSNCSLLKLSFGMKTIPKVKTNL